MLKLIIIVGLLTFVNAKLPRMTIHREENFIKTVGHVNAEKTHILNKYNMEMDEATSCYEELESFNLLYYGYITVGTPPQNIKVLFDTASQYLFVPRNAFNATASETFLSISETFQYNDFMKIGTTINVQSAGADTVQVGGFTIFNQIVGITAEPFTNSSYQGLLGLGPSQFYEGVPSVGPPVLDNMYRQGLITERVFSLYMMTTDFTSNTPIFGGEIIFGGSDATLYQGSLNYVDVTFAAPYNWTILVDNIKVGDQFLNRGFEAILDTATDLIGCSALDYALINAKFNGYVDEDGNYIVNCANVKTFPNITFNINEAISVTLTPQDYIVDVLGVNNTVLCMSIISFTTANYWILGTPVLSKFYLEYDYEQARIGFAIPQPNAVPSEPILPLPFNPLPKKICNRSPNL